MARRSIRADDYPGRRAGDIATGARRGAWAGRPGVETPRTQALGRPCARQPEMREDPVNDGGSSIVGDQLHAVGTVKRVSLATLHWI